MPVKCDFVIFIHLLHFQGWSLTILSDVKPVCCAKVGQLLSTLRYTLWNTMVKMSRTVNVQRHAGTCEVYRAGRGWRWAASWEWWPSTPASWSPANKHAAKLFTGWCIISDNLCSYMQDVSPPGENNGAPQVFLSLRYCRVANLSCTLKAETSCHLLR